MINKKILLIIGSVLLAAALCTATENQDKEFKFDPEASFAFYLSDKDLAEAKIKAVTGDAGAALKVALYYETVKRESASSYGWMYISADHGNVTAQLNMAHWHLYDKRFKNVKFAVYWLEKAKNNGSEKAKELLDKIKQPGTISD